MINRIDLGGGAVRYEGPTGSVYLQSTRGGTVLDTRYSGTFGIEFVAPLIADVERRTLGATEIKLLCDLSEMKDFSAEFRNAWVEWFRANQHRIERSVFLHRSVIIKIGLTIVGVALRGKLESFTDAEAFEKARLQYGLTPIRSDASAA